MTERQPTRRAVLMVDIPDHPWQAELIGRVNAETFERHCALIEHGLQELGLGQVTRSDAGPLHLTASNVAVHIGPGALAGSEPTAQSTVVLLDERDLTGLHLPATLRALAQHRRQLNLVLVPHQRLCGRLAAWRVATPAAWYRSPRDLAEWLRLAHGYGRGATTT